MARWDIYNIVGDATPLLDYQVQSRDWDWNERINPTPDVGLAFQTIVRPLTESEQEWTSELFSLLGRNRGGRILKFEGSTSDGSVICQDLRVDEDGAVTEADQWQGTIVNIYRIDEDTIYDKAKHEWNSVDDELTIKSVPYSTRNVDGGQDPDPRFHCPLLNLIEEETGLQVVYNDHWRNGWRTSGELPECVYETKELPDHIK